MMLPRTKPLICSGQGNHAHSVNLDGSLLGCLVENITLQALQKEPAVWPHFGLVSPTQDGAHEDMSYATICASSHAIAPYLRQCFQLAYQNQLLEQEQLSNLFPLLRQIGVQAEKEMLRATDQVNTHKGAIFLLLVLIGALGALKAAQPSANITIKALLAWAHQLASPHLLEDFNRAPVGISQTYGEWAYARFGIEGVRGVVNQEFQLLKHAFHYVSRIPASKREVAYAQMRLFFLAHSEDTNILKRGGFDQYQSVRRNALHAIQQGGVFTLRGCAEINQLEGYMRRRQLSAAASGDMMILLMMVTNLYEKNLISG